MVTTKVPTGVYADQDPVSPYEVHDSSQAAHILDNEYLSCCWYEVDVPGSPRLSRLMEALTIECGDCIPALSLDSSASPNDQMYLAGIETDEHVLSQEKIGESTSASPNDRVSHSQKVLHQGDILSLVPERNRPEPSYSKCSVLKWELWRDRPMKTKLDYLYGISLFPESPEPGGSGTPCLGNSSRVSGSLNLQFAESDCKNQLGNLKKSFGPKHPQTLRAMTYLAHIYIDQYKLRQAERLYRQVTISYQRVLGSEHIDTLSSYLDVIDTMKARGELLRALKIHRPIHDFIMKIFKPDRKIALRSNSIQADILHCLHQLEEAEKLSRQTVQIDLSTFGPRWVGTLYDMKTFAVILRLSGKLFESEQLLWRILQLYRIGPRVSDRLFSSTVDALASVLMDQGRYEECKELTTASLEQMETPDVHGHARVLYPRFLAAQCSRLQGDLETSESQLWQLLGRDIEVFGEMHPLTSNILTELSNILRATGRMAEAAKIIERSYRIRTVIFGIGSWKTLFYCLQLGKTYEALGRHEDAIPLYHRSLDHFRIVGAPPNADLLRAMQGLAGHFRETGRCREAMPLYEECLSEFVEYHGISDPLTTYSCDCLGVCYEKLGRFDDALELYQWFFDKLQMVEGDEHPALGRVIGWITDLKVLALNDEEVDRIQDDRNCSQIPSVDGTSVGDADMNPYGVSVASTALAEEKWMAEVFDFEMLAEGPLELIISDDEA
jgi:tetratricopeptide (TPR) repeat protein